MDAAAWRAHWADAEARYLAERDERYARIGGRDESVSRSAVAVAPIVLEPAVEVESDSCPVAATRRAHAAALGAGWSARITRAVAAVPKVGVLTTWALRARRHDERLWACWWGGSFNAAQHWSPRGIEVLGWRTVTKRRGVVDALEGLHLTRHWVGVDGRMS